MMMSEKQIEGEEKMKQELIRLWGEEEYKYPLAFGFVPSIMPYLHEDGQSRPGIIIVPGGAYYVVSPTEAGIVAEKFFDMGYQAFVLTYTTNVLVREPLKEQPLKDLTRAIRYVRAHAAELCVNPDEVAICGFSAGGHLSASACVYWDAVEETHEAYRGISARPDAAVLSYPVITSGEYAHKGSFEALLGMEGEPGSEQAMAWEKMSLEKHVRPDTPPCFLWQTATDELVPVENSYLFAAACKENGVPFEHHVFAEGAHGLSLANEDWEEGRFGVWYTAEQLYCLYDAIRSGLIEVSDEDRERVEKPCLVPADKHIPQRDPGRRGNKAVQIWPELANTWLRLLWEKK